MIHLQHAASRKPRNPRSFAAPRADVLNRVPGLLSRSMLGLLAGLALSAYAQNDPAPPRNAFGENLQPRIKRNAAFQDQPYNPIKKQDDQAQIPEIEMFVGESRVFPTPGVARIAVGNGQIMTAAALDNKEVIIFANAVGTSSLFVWNEDGRYQRVKVNIVPGDTTRIAREVATFLSAMPNTRTSIVGDKVIVEGDNLSDADLYKIEQLEKRYPQIINFTNRVGWEQMVMMDVKVVEFPVSELRDIGLKWASTGGAAVGAIWQPVRRGSDGPFQINILTGQDNPVPIVNPSGSGGVLLPSSPNIISAVNLGLNAQLNLLVQEGKASILAEPQLSARNGSKASFLAGGEFPYSVSTINGVTIIFKPYGIKLDIQPKVDHNGVIRATIDSEVSKIDPTVSTVAGPALLTRRTNTEFNVKSGETIILSGLIQLDNSTNIDKVPLLGDIPVLGALFRSKRFQNKETELVVFVTPTVVDSHSPGLVDRIERTTERLQRNLGRPPYLSNPLQPGSDPAKPNLKPSSGAGETAAPSVVGAAKIPAVEPTPMANSNQATLERTELSAQLSSSDRNPRKSDKRSASGGSILRVKRDGLVLRSEPDNNSRALLQLGYGAIVQLGAADPEPKGVGNWRNVVVGEINGWVLSKWVEPAHMRTFIRSLSDSAVAKPDREGKEVGPTAKGRVIEVGSVREVTPFSLFSDDAVNDVAPARYRVALNQLALRVTPDVNAPIVRNLSEGQLVEALRQPSSGYWIAVEADGVRGWAAIQWLNPVASEN